MGHCPIIGLGKLDMISQHAMHKQAIPACNQPTGSQESQDTLSQHAVGQLKAREFTHNIPACSGNQSQIRKARHAFPAYTAQCYPSIHCKI